jgi:peptidoglycan/xylan/chitin deacetylase (PgdA/CDA1 family)
MAGKTSATTASPVSAVGQTNAPAEKPASTPAPNRSVNSYSEVHVDGPYIAMTFDDGPSDKLTPELLDILKAHHIHATFFVIGQNAERFPQIMQRAVREGHEIGSHSWSHPAFAKMSESAVRRELQRTDDVIRAAIGHSPVLLRPPYGSITPHQKQWIHADFGYEIVLWDVDPLDWKRPGPSVVMNRILKETRPGSIILSHDIHPGTIKAMPETFDKLQAKGFKFVTVSELIAMAKPRPANESHGQESIASPTPIPSGFAFPTPAGSASPGVAKP